MQLVTDIEPYILWNNIVPINPLKQYSANFSEFTNQIYPDILKNMQEGYTFFSTIKAQILNALNLYNNYELLTLQEQDFPSFLQLYSLLVLKNENFNLLTPTNIYAPFQGIYRAMFKTQKGKTQKSQKSKNQNEASEQTIQNNKLTPNIAILPVYSYLSGIPIKETEVLSGLAATRIYDYSQIFLNIVANGLDSLGYTSTPNVFIVSARALHIPIDSLFVFIKKTDDHKKLLDYLASKEHVTPFDTGINNISWLNTWQNEQSSLISLFALYKTLNLLTSEVAKDLLNQKDAILNKLYTELTDIIGTNRKFLLPPDKPYYNIALKLPVYMAQKIYNELARNYILIDYITKSAKTAYLIFTLGLETPNYYLQETLELLHKVM